MNIEEKLAKLTEKILSKVSLKDYSDEELVKAYLAPFKKEEKEELEKPFLELLKEMRKECASEEQVEIVCNKQQEFKRSSQRSIKKTDSLPMPFDLPLQKKVKKNDENPLSVKAELKLKVNIFATKDTEKLTSIPNWNRGLLNFFIHCRKYIKESRLSLKVNQKKLSLQVLDLTKKTSNPHQNYDVELDPLPLYEIFPSFLWVTFEYGDDENVHNELDACLEAVDPKNIVISASIPTRSDYHETYQTETSDDLTYSRLRKIICFFNQKPYVHFTSDSIDRFREDLKRDCAGFDHYANKIHEEFVSTLTSSIYDRPKGILFYGPPRTGKTHCSKKVIELLGLWRIYSDIAAGDFNKSLVGQSEQMVNKIVDRCDVLPWELCCLFIDEIDGLCPNRKGPASSGKVDLISVFLTVMDGNKIKTNLLIIGTSNRLKYMDDAFVQRMDIKLFIGLPDITSKQDWIRRTVEKAERSAWGATEDMVDESEEAQSYFKKLKKLITVVFKDNILRYTLNFTADAMKKSLGQIMTNAIQKKDFWAASPDNELKEDIKELIYKSLNRICENDKIYISICTPPELVKELDSVQNAEKYLDVNWNILRKQQVQEYTQRMLIDLKEPAEERFQLEVKKSDIIGKSQLETVQKIKNYLNKKTNDKVLEEFKLFFSNYYDNFHPNYKIDLETNPESRRGFFELFITQIWPKILNEDKNNSIETFRISHDDILISSHDALQILMRMAVEAKIDVVLVFDTAYFTKAGITTDEGMAQEILIATEEVTQYRSCLVVFNLDSIADITKEYNSLQSDIKTASQIAYSNDKNDPQFAYSINRNQAFRAALECLSTIPKPEKNHWFVAISNHNKLTLDFKEKVNWPATNQQKKIEKEIILNNVPKTCQHCFETYREKDNDPNDCGRHSSPYLYDEDYLNSLKAIYKDEPEYDPFKDTSEIVKRLLYVDKNYVSIQLKALNGSNLANHRLGRFKWLCCQKSFWEKGELKAKHSSL